MLAAVFLAAFTFAIFEFKRAITAERRDRPSGLQLVLGLVAALVSAGSLFGLRRSIGADMIHSIWNNLFEGFLALFVVASFSIWPYGLLSIAYQKIADSIGRLWAVVIVGLACVGVLAMGFASLYLLNAIYWTHSLNP